MSILVIANASGAPKPQVFGINLPVATKKRRRDPAFKATEAGVMRDKNSCDAESAKRSSRLIGAATQSRLN